jgi:hypothetical protein
MAWRQRLRSDSGLDLVRESSSLGFDFCLDFHLVSWQNRMGLPFGFLWLSVEEYILWVYC